MVVHVCGSNAHACTPFEYVVCSFIMRPECGVAPEKNTKQLCKSSYHPETTQESNDIAWETPFTRPLLFTLGRWFLHVYAIPTNGKSIACALGLMRQGLDSNSTQGSWHHAKARIPPAICIQAKLALPGIKTSTKPLG